MSTVVNRTIIFSLGPIYEIEILTFCNGIWVNYNCYLRIREENNNLNVNRKNVIVSQSMISLNVRMLDISSLIFSWSIL